MLSEDVHYYNCLQVILFFLLTVVFVLLNLEMTSKNTSSRERQCHARPRSGPKRAKGREARGNDHLSGGGEEGLMSVVCSGTCNQYEKKTNVLTSLSTKVVRGLRNYSRKNHAITDEAVIVK